MISVMDATPDRLDRLDAGEDPVGSWNDAFGNVVDRSTAMPCDLYLRALPFAVEIGTGSDASIHAFASLDKALAFADDQRRRARHGAGEPVIRIGMYAPSSQTGRVVAVPGCTVPGSAPPDPGNAGGSIWLSIKKVPTVLNIPGIEVDLEGNTVFRSGECSYERIWSNGNSTVILRDGMLLAVWPASFRIFDTGWTGPSLSVLEMSDEAIRMLDDGEDPSDGWIDAFGNTVCRETAIPCGDDLRPLPYGVEFGTPRDRKLQLYGTLEEANAEAERVYAKLSPHLERFYACTGLYTSNSAIESAYVAAVPGGLWLGLRPMPRYRYAQLRRVRRLLSTHTGTHLYPPVAP
ncbi:MAG: hypothetical protein Q4Q58_04265 [Thermoplasmata archaeon]|nr:hypothetical protein [Thermoplasmata archaeon]